MAYRLFDSTIASAVARNNHVISDAFNLEAQSVKLAPMSGDSSLITDCLGHMIRSQSKPFSTACRR
jgi:hypothetical protein